MGDERVHDDRRLNALVAWLLVALFLAQAVRLAWLGDDALITLRTVLNTLAGYGAGFNAGERVQAYTHPLWFLLILGGTAVLGNVYAAAFALSLAFSAAAFALLVRVAASGAGAAALAGATILLSKPAMDFSTSGLENPLANLILVAVVLAARAEGDGSGPRLRAVSVLVGLLYLTRPDLVLLAAPLVVVEAWRSRARPARIVGAMVLGAAAPLLWTAFSLFYYGSPLPNTAAAKLATGIPRADLLLQGGFYFIDSLARSPLTLGAIAVSAAVAARAGGAGRAVAAGVVLYLAYVLWVGGDFMSGRFLVAPLYFGLAFAAGLTITRTAALPFAAALGVAGVIGAPGTLLAAPDYADTRLGRLGQIADERAFFSLVYGLANQQRSTFQAPDWSMRHRTFWQICGMIGTHGIEMGPGAHIVDQCGLTDALIARMPMVHDVGWRPGHYFRYVPPGYVDSLRSGRNLIQDPEIRPLYEDSAW